MPQTLTYACEVQDDTGQVIHLEKPAKRIISLAPDLTELLFAAGAGSNIVGVIQGSDYPKAAKQIMVVGTYQAISSETLLALHPDLVIAWGTTRITHTLKELGIPVFISSQQRLKDIPKTILKFGCLAGTEMTARTAAHAFDADYQELVKQYQHQKILKVFYQLWPRPLLTVNRKSWISDVIALCGGENMFDKAWGATPTANLEAVVTANPQVILSASQNDDWQKSWQQWPNLPAVKDQNLFTIPNDLLERAGPRLLQGARQVCIDLQHARQQS